MNYLLTIIFLAVTVLSYGQREIFNTNFYKTKALEKPNPSAQKHFEEKYSTLTEAQEEWHKGFRYNSEMEEEEEVIHFAFFRTENYVYTVVYEITGKWVATEKRSIKKGDFLGYDGEYPSYAIFSKKIKNFLKKNEYSMNPNESERGGAFMDAYEIEVPSMHPMAKKHQTTTFYVVNWDGVCIAATQRKKIKMENRFYTFY